MSAVAHQICLFDDCRHVNCVYLDDVQVESDGENAQFTCEACGRKQSLRSRAFHPVDDKPSGCHEADIA